ncbi:MAG: hypothetical protein MUF15_08935 [Acidobacteria bacterium]|jgi:hypothetical protein|nr:hypothetical protein [Acidobacteriota bacterium]
MIRANVQEIENAVAHLPEPELDEFRVWFEKFDEELWDKQLKQDVANGKLDHLADQALMDFDEGLYQTVNHQANPAFWKCYENLGGKWHLKFKNLK